MSCEKGKIKRDASHVKGYTRSDGTHVKGYYRSSSCVKDMGNPGKGPKLIPIKKGSLGYYSPQQKEHLRHQHLNELVDSSKSKSGQYAKALSVYRDLVAHSTLTKNTQPKNSKNYKDDANWLKKKHKIGSAKK